MMKGSHNPIGKPYNINPPTLEEDFYSELRHSNEVFAAFKVHSMAVRMADKLLDEHGKLKPFRQWKDEVKGISDHYNGTWLRTEYNTAVIRAHNAADWRQFERNRDIMPNLRWMPTTSPNPEAEHRSFWEMKLTRPIDDSFWNKHRPGNRWNCKCSLEATDDPITDLPNDEFIRADKPQRGLENNPGKDGKIFSEKHPYFPKNCKECGFNKRKGLINFLGDFLNNETKDGFCNKCEYISRVISPITYNGAHKRLTISHEADKSELVDNIRAANAILDSFTDVHINIRKHVIKHKEKNAEYEFGDILGDRKAIKSVKGVADAFCAAKEQGCKIVVLDLDKHFTRVNVSKLSSRLVWRHEDFANGMQCYIVFNEKAILIKNEDIQSLNNKERIRNKIKELGNKS